MATRQPDGPDEPDDVAVLRALADPARFQIVRRLAAGEELTSGELERSLGLSKSTISHHLRLLTSVGLVRLTRRGRVQALSLDHDTLAGLAARLGDLARPDPLEQSDAPRTGPADDEPMTW